MGGDGQDLSDISMRDMRDEILDHQSGRAAYNTRYFLLIEAKKNSGSRLTE